MLVLERKLLFYLVLMLVLEKKLVCYPVLLLVLQRKPLCYPVSMLRLERKDISWLFIIIFICKMFVFSEFCYIRTSIYIITFHYGSIYKPNIIFINAPFLLLLSQRNKG